LFYSATTGESCWLWLSILAASQIQAPSLLQEKHIAYFYLYLTGVTNIRIVTWQIFTADAMHTDRTARTYRTVIDPCIVQYRTEV
jgi:hypothetical protein